MNKANIDKILNSEETLDLTKAAEAIQEQQRLLEIEKAKRPPSRTRSLQAWQNKKAREQKDEAFRQKFAKYWPKTP